MARGRRWLVFVVVLSVAAPTALVGWVAQPDAPQRGAAPPLTAEERATVRALDEQRIVPPDNTPATTTTTTATTLPVPEPPPADEYAPTPVVVHGTVALPTLNVEQSLYEGVTLTAIDQGPSHWPGTAMPGGVGNVVVAGHRVTHTRPFYDLDLLRPGDPLVFTLADGTSWTYEHTSTEIVSPDALHIIDQTPARTATLFACHPKGSLEQRIVARFRLVAPP